MITDADISRSAVQPPGKSTGLTVQHERKALLKKHGPLV